MPDGAVLGCLLRAYTTQGEGLFHLSILWGDGGAIPSNRPTNLG